VLQAIISLLPVLLFLLSLVYLDSYKLVSLRGTLLTILFGCVVAGAAFLVNTAVAALFDLERSIESRYIAPLLEESLKAVYLLYLIRRERIGFMVDAAIRGFAIGAGFALVENIYYLQLRPEAGVVLWVVRGFGTAIMHGGATAIVGVLAKSLLDRYGSSRLVYVLPGLFVAVVVHVFYNHFFVSPIVSTLAILIVLPMILVLVFNRSEKVTRNWLGVGFDSDRELLEMITTGTLSETRIGTYLHSLETHFPAGMVADMLCYLRVYLELSIKAKGVLLMREAGFEIDADPDVRDQLAELAYLEKTIGKTGMRTLMPCLGASRRDLWQLQLLVPH
jgi:RsiW-degrading membrane proteinase PrsW (M82 family)